MRLPTLRPLFASAALLLTVGVLRADDAPAPLHERIDALLAADKALPIGADEEFLRRVTLDLTGTIPTAAETQKFLADGNADKRRQLVDHLLASPAYARHLANVFDVMLMERREDRHVKNAQWQEHLRTAFAANRPWDVLVREIITADGADPKARPAAAFSLNRLGEPHLLTRDVGRLFLGVNLQCAQCHDHPRVTHYKQDHYYGIYAFLNRSALVADPKSKAMVFVEKNEGDATYVSVFDPAKVVKHAGPRMPFMARPEEAPVTAGVRSAGASRRAQLAAELTSPANAQFRRNLANRLWALLMGRGLVHPLDLDHPSNPSTHPELLALLADEVAALRYDVRGFLRELALTRVYQQPSRQPNALTHLKPLTPEQLAWSLMQATGHIDAERQTPTARGLPEAAFLDRLAKQAAPVVRAFAGPAGQDPAQPFQPTSTQALLLANGEPLAGWLTDRPGTLLHRLAKLTEADAVADEVYLTVLTRRPTADDRRAVAEFLAAQPKDRSGALRDLAWALLTSAEFRFNH